MSGHTKQQEGTVIHNLKTESSQCVADDKRKTTKAELRHLTEEEAQSYHLTEEEAHSFIENVLSISDIHERIRKDRLSLLNSLIYAMHQTIPYQTIYRCSIPLKERRRSPFSQIKQHMFSKYGGTCTEIQPFFKCLLDAIGYKTDYFPTTVLGNFEVHVTIIVHDLISEGSKHVVDVACVSPTFFAIPLDFEVESPIYSSSFLVYKYIRRSDGIVNWLHHSRTDINGWFKFGELNVSKLVDISYFLQNIDHFVTDLSEEMHRVVWASHYKRNCFVWIRGKTLKWSEGKKLLSRDIDTKEELRALLQMEFPLFPEKMIEQSVLLTESLCKQLPKISH